ncbi:MAG TPA: LysM peptidoglycan-binding domain-containing protein [Ardenticatenaceae bacterium]|nr:LysM peptidoglycan-binding domain-containing protein [Ardenticatenaceae bacterium]
MSESDGQHRRGITRYAWYALFAGLLVVLLGCQRGPQPVEVVLSSDSSLPAASPAVLASPGTLSATSTPPVTTTAGPPVEQASATFPITTTSTVTMAAPTTSASATIGPDTPRGPIVYTVQAGDSLSAIADRFGVTLAELMVVNGIADPNMIYVGQKLHIPQPQEAPEGPSAAILPDSEVVYSPAYKNFNTIGEIRRFGGLLATHTEEVEGEILTGPEIVDRVAKRYSIGPRVLLALLEMQSGWVTNPNPTEREYPMGQREGARVGLFLQLSWAANRLNEGYYGKLLGRRENVLFQDGAQMRFGAGLNPGTAAIQYLLAQVNTPESWQQAIGEEGFPTIYRRLFGDPQRRALPEVVPAGLRQPPLTLPWAPGEVWYLTSGPHGGWGEGSARAALDFVPPTLNGCSPAGEWALAVADGIIARSENGEVVLDLDGDGFIGTGWTVLYMHIASEGRVARGTRVRVGDRIGHPSCEGGFSDATHLHLARRYNGQWMQADAAPVFDLDGWQAVAWERSYDGELVRDDQRVQAETGVRGPINAISRP